MGEIKYIVGLTMIALFSIAIIAYVIGFGNDNSADINLADAEGFTNMNNHIKNNLTKFSKVDVNSSSNTFFPSDIEAGDDVMNSGYSFKIGLMSLVGAVGSIFSLAGLYLFGGSSSTFSIFLTTLYSLLIFIGIRYIYKSWVGKNPD